MLTEFGGIAFTAPESREHTWGYNRSEDESAFAHAFGQLMDTVRRLTLLAGYCYTQFADTYQEANGLLYADRTPKLPLEQIALATSGAKTTADAELEKREALLDQHPVAAGG
jgi:hypothetical protein